MIEPPSEKLLSREFVTLGLSTMCFFGAMGAANPVLPKFVSEELGASDTVVGVVLGSFAVASLILRPLFGRLGDQRGARLLMIIGSIVGALGMFSYLLVGNIGGAIAARLPFGAAQAAIMTGSTTLAVNLAPPDRRGEAASYILVAFHLGLGLGPLLGEAARGAWGFDGVWISLGLLCLLGLVVALALPHHEGAIDLAPAPLLHPNGVVPGLVISIGMMAFMSFSIFVPLYAEEIGVDKVGPVFLVASVSIAVVRLVFSKLPDRWGPIRSGTVALAAIICGSVVLGAWGAPAGMFVGAAVLAGGGALLMPALVPAVIHEVEPHRRSSAMATFTMFLDITAAITGPLFGAIAGVTSYRTAFVCGTVTSATSLAILRVRLAPRWAARSG